jgi:hypothetical protein
VVVEFGFVFAGQGAVADVLRAGGTLRTYNIPVFFCAGDKTVVG